MSALDKRFFFSSKGHHNLRLHILEFPNNILLFQTKLMFDINKY